MFKPDLFYMTPTATGFGFYKDFLIILILKLTGVKMLFHFHNKGVASRQHRFIDNILYKIAFNKSFCILLSPLLYFDIQKYIPRQRVFFCANGIPDCDYLGTGKKENENCQILFLSNMMKEKGVYILLEACKILHNKGVTFITWFIGSWLDINENDFNAFVFSNNLKENVFYGGAKYGTAKSVYFERANIFVFPTYYNNEVFPLVILEAMQYGLPVISTREGGIPDIVEDGKTGYLVNKNDPKDLADKIELLINNPFLRQQMGEAGKEKFQNNYTISIWENNMLVSSRFWYAKYFKDIYETMLFNNLQKVCVILASADRNAIIDFNKRSNNRIHDYQIVQFPTRIDTNIFKPVDRTFARTKFNIDPQRKLIVTTGRLSWLKGWKFMIDCFELFITAYPNSDFYFLGDGEDRSRIEKYIYLRNLNSRIFLMGKLEPQKIALYLNACNLYIMGSYIEGWSTSLVEAIACGVPVCITNFSSANELVSDNVNGFVCDNRDEIEFVGKMDQALNISKKVLLEKSFEMNKFSVTNLKSDLIGCWSVYSEIN